MENKLAKGPTTLADYTYAEDSLGNITQIHDAVTATFNRDFAYDDLNRLTTANSGTGLWGTAAGNGYAYDKMGNVTSVTLGTSRTASFVYSGTLPKLTSVTETGLGTRSVTYDSAANETQVGTGTLTYSTRNFLKAADSLTYGYDGKGLRTTVTQGSNKRYFFYSPEMSLLEETSLARTPTAAGGYDEIWFNGHPVAEEDGGTHWTFTDHLGTPFIQTDSTGNFPPFWRAEYEPYGRVFSLRGITNQHAPMRLPGQEAEELNVSTDGNGTTERFYNVFRWYRPRWGRYSQADPIGFYRYTEINLYRYASDSPLEVTDPLGKDVVTAVGVDATFFLARCSVQVFSEARRLGSQPGVGPRWAHCWASCQLVKRCGSPGFARMLGFGKEVADVGRCFFDVLTGHPSTTPACSSAFQPSDFADNAFGRGCPTDKPCEDRCKPLRGVPDAPPGPFYGFGQRRGDGGW